MIITDLIKALQQKLEQFGDVEVEVRNPAGDFDLAEDIQTVNVARKSSKTTWRVYIDT